MELYIILATLENFIISNEATGSVFSGNGWMLGFSIKAK